MNKIDQNSLTEALELLGELIEEKPAQHFVVCGGSSLLALGLVQRTTTRDVDVLASVENGKLVTAKPLPEWLRQAAGKVRVDLGLMENWFNTGPSDDSFFRLGFPSGIEERLVTRDYGSTLRISFISRYDQIFFKLYATVDSGPGRHFQDIQDLTPNREELFSAARWCRSQDPSEGFLLVLGQVLKYFDHEFPITEL